MVGPSEENANSPDELVDDLLLEYNERLDAGEKIAPDDFIAEHAEYQEQLSRYFDNVVAVESLAGPRAEEEIEGTVIAGETHDGGFAETMIENSSSGDAARISKDAPLTQFGRYRIRQELGRGAMGAVYLAHDEQLDREVALKIPKFETDGNSELLERFYREARAAAALQHPGICPVHDVGELDGQHYITMAFIKGRPLRDFTKSSKRQKGKQVARVIRKIAMAMAEAHEHNVVHRDLKPANIMINERNEPVVMDFGLARRSAEGEEQLTHTGTVIGTPAYMSPEQVDGDNEHVGSHSDIYSLGVIFYEMLTGQLPFQGNLMSILKQIALTEPKPPIEIHADIDPSLQAICLKMMAKKIEDRPASMSDVARDLTQWLQGRQVVADETEPLETSRVPGQSSGEEVSATTPVEEAPPVIVLQEPEATLSRGRKTASKEVPPGKRKLMIAGVLGSAVILLAAIVFFVRLGKVNVQITVDDSSLALKVDGDEIVIDGNEAPIRLSAGTHELVVKQGNLEFEAKEFKVTKDGKNAIHVVVADEKVHLLLNGATPPGSSSSSAGSTAVAAIANPRPRDSGIGRRSLQPLTATEILTSPDWEWTEPVNLGAPINSSADDGDPFLSSNGLTLFFSSDRQLGSDKDIWMSTRPAIDSLWSDPVNVKELNSQRLDARPRLSPDGRTIVFRSAREGGQGSWDLWVSTRESTSTDWHSPRNLGPNVNTPKEEGGHQFSADGLSLTFMSTRTGRQQTYVTRRASLLSTEWSLAERFDRQGLPSFGVERFVSDRFATHRAGINSWPLVQRSRASTDVLWGPPTPIAIPGNQEANSFQESYRSECISNDGQTMLFSALRAGGVGNWDIWMSRRVRKSSSSTAPGQLPLAVAPFDSTLPNDRQQGWRPIFDGRSLDGWTRTGGPPDDWRVENGILVGDGDRTRLVYTREKFSDFDLRVECRQVERTNSVVFLRCDEQGDQGYKALLAGRRASPTGGNRTGAIFGKADFKENLVTTGEWFVLEARYRDKRITLFVNGRQTAECSVPARSNLLRTIGLQSFSRGQKVEFRKIELRVASQAQPTSLSPPLPKTEVTVSSHANINAYDVLTSPDWKWTEPVNLGPEINSPARDSCPSVTRDGLTMVFASSRDSSNQAGDIFMSTRKTTESHWSSAIHIKTINTARTESEPAISPDGRTLVFYAMHSDRKGNSDLWMSSRGTSSAAWSEGKSLGPNVNSPEADHAPQFSDDGLSVTFESTRTGPNRKFVIRRSSLDSTVWSRPEVVAQKEIPITGGRLFAGGRVALFRSSLAGPKASNPVLLQQVRRSKDEAWGPSEPIAIPGNESATDKDERYDTPHLSRDGRTLWFAAERLGGHGGRDIWMSRRVRVGSAHLNPEKSRDVSANLPLPAVAPFDADQAKAHQQAWADYLGVPVEKEVELPGGEKMAFMLIPAAEFQMGSTKEEQAQFIADAKNSNDERAASRIVSEGPQHTVRLTQPFRMSRHEITRGQFREFVDDSGYRTTAETNGKGGMGIVDGNTVRSPKFNWYTDSGLDQTDNHPVINVSWDDANAFCQWLSKKYGTAYHLPSEAQWEFVCRAGSTTPWYCGEHHSSLQQHCWHGPNADRKTHPVGRLKSNQFGIYDMHGNVREWCIDWAERQYSGLVVSDPDGPPDGSERVCRGGSWDKPPRLCRAAFRGRSLYDSAGRDIGFRVVMAVDTGNRNQPTAPSVTNVKPADEEPQLAWQAPEQPSKFQLRNNAPDGLIGTMSGHTRFIQRVAFSPDSKRILSSSWNSKLRLHDVETGQELKFKNTQTPPGAFAVDSAFNSVLTFGARDKPAILWDMNSGLAKQQFPGKGQVNWVALSQDGKIAAIARPSGVSVWNAESGELLHQELGKHTSSARFVDFSAEGQKIVTTAGDTLNVFDVQSGKRLSTATPGPVAVAQFTTDGKKLVGGGKDATLYAWDVTTLAPIAQLTGHTDRICSLALTASSRHAVTGSPDRTIRVWDLQQQKQVHEFDARTYNSVHVAISPDGRYVASGGGAVPPMGVPADSDYRLHLWKLPQLDGLQTASAKDE